MRCDLIFITYAKDYPYLHYALRSVEKFASGFGEVVILVPTKDLESLKSIVAELPGTSGIPFRCIGGVEWPDKGMLWHEAMIVSADNLCPDADIICHSDADVIFTAPAPPDTFFTNGKPNLRYESFASIGRRHPGVLKWKDAAEAALPFAVDAEFMRGHCHCYTRETYQKTRELIKEKTGFHFSDYIRSCENSFPQGFAEHPTLGAVAFKYFHDHYFPIDCAKTANPDLNPYPVGQFWSHGPMDKPQHIWWKGSVQEIIPMDKFKELGLT